MEQVRREIEEVKYFIEQAKRSEEYTLVLENVNGRKYVLSKYTPKATAKKSFEVKSENKETVWIVFGFGFGYMIESLLTQCGEKANVVVVEPDKALLEEQLKKCDYEYFKEKENVVFFTGTEFKEFKETLSKILYYGNIGNICVLEHPGYIEFYLRYYQKVVQIISELRVRNVINHNTIKQINDAHIYNVLKNRDFINTSYSIEKHKDKYKGIPAVIISAGPSLSKNVEYIKEFKGLNFAVGRTLPLVKKQGAEVDFTALIDWSDMIQDTFQGEEQSDVPLIALSVGNHNVIQNTQGPLYIIDEKKIAAKMFGRKLERLDVGGSVATLCLSAAYYMGCDPIIFIGQDLAYTGLKGYAEGCNVFEGNIKEEYEKGTKGYKEIDGYNGEKVVSDYALISFLRWIEEFIDNNNDRTYINATEGGARIQGTVQMTFKQVIEQYKDVIKPTVEHIRDEGVQVDVAHNLKKCQSNLEESVQLLKVAIKLNEKLKEEYTLYKGIRENKIVKIVQNLDEIDAKLLKLENNVLFDYIFNAKYNDIVVNVKYQEPIKETELEKGVRVAEKSYILYKDLSNSVEEVVDLIKKEVEGDK